MVQTIQPYTCADPALLFESTLWLQQCHLTSNSALVITARAHTTTRDKAFNTNLNFILSLKVKPLKDLPHAEVSP